MCDDPRESMGPTPFGRKRLNVRLWVDYVNLSGGMQSSVKIVRKRNFVF